MSPLTALIPTHTPVVAVYAGGAISQAGLAALLRSELIDVQTPEDEDELAHRKPVDVILLTGTAPAYNLPASVSQRHHDAPVLLLTEEPLTFEALVQLGAHGAVCRECTADRLTRGVHALAGGGGFFECHTHVHEPAPAPLSERERRVATELARGSGIPELAATLCISPHTARTHVRNIRRKLGARTSTQAVARAITLGLVALSPP
jgi:DNA-binding NarL/FixJ family response regulator